MKTSDLSVLATLDLPGWSIFANSMPSIDSGQIARRVNSGGVVYPDETDEISAKLTENSKLFGNILEQLSKIK